MNEKDVLEIGERAPEFCLLNQNDEEFCLNDITGKWLVLYFYPKDNTGGCTREAQDFTTYKDKFKKLNAEITGVSPDSTKSHINFIEKKELDITLLSDPEKEVLKKYNAWQLKKRSGKEYYGVVRTTYLINPDGIIKNIWRNVTVKGHSEEVFKRLEELTK